MEGSTGEGRSLADSIALRKPAIKKTGSIGRRNKPKIIRDRIIIMPATMLPIIMTALVKKFSIVIEFNNCQFYFYEVRSQSPLSIHLRIGMRRPLPAWQKVA